MDDATELAVQIRSGDMSPDEAVAEARARIEERMEVNAVVIPLADEGPAADPDGAFFGVPSLLKDLGGCLEGLPLYQGNQLLRAVDARARASSPFLLRLVAAGFRFLGKTNTPEFGGGATTQPKSFGPTRNPWSSAYSVSGSSGGSAAAVAAGLVPLAHGNDYGGSIRMPAAWCGVIGLKPSRGRVATGAPPGLVTEFVLTRSLRDTAAVLDVVADGLPPTAGPRTTWLASHAEPARRSRIGLVTAVDGVATDADAAHRATEAADALAGRGHEVVPLPSSFLADPDWDAMQLRLRIRGARSRVDALTGLAGRTLTVDDVEPLMLALAARAADVSDDDGRAAEAWQVSYGRRLTAAFDAAALDAVITPTTGIEPQLTDHLEPPDDEPIAILETYRRIGCFAGCWNISGHPAISLPWWTPPADRLPRGVQVVGGIGGEDHMLRLANELAALRPDRTAVRAPPPG